jgi:hypothetical protein
VEVLVKRHGRIIKQVGEHFCGKENAIDTQKGRGGGVGDEDFAARREQASKPLSSASLPENCRPFFWKRRGCRRAVQCRTSLKEIHMPVPPVEEVGAPASGGRRAWWVWLVAGGYALLILGVVLLPWIVTPREGSDWIALAAVTVAWLSALGGLLFVPLQAGRRRVLTRGTIWIPLMVSGFLAGLLALAVGIACGELFKWEDPALYAILGGALATWGLWTGVFYLLSRQGGRTRMGLTLHRWLLAGSVLELLVAVPAHIIVRRRNECCAGMMTGTAIAVGVLVMLAAFGPSVALLYVSRWRRIRVRSLEERRGFEVELGSSVTQKVAPEENLHKDE